MLEHHEKFDTKDRGQLNATENIIHKITCHTCKVASHIYKTSCRIYKIDLHVLFYVANFKCLYLFFVFNSLSHKNLQS